MPLPSRLSCFGSLLLAAALAPGLAAPPASTLPDHCDILRGMPLTLLDFSGSGPEAPGSGQSDTNSKVASLQLGASMKLAFAAAGGNPGLADECWGAVDSLFAHQTKAGDFGTAPASAAVSLCELGRSLLVIQQSPLADSFKNRIEALKPAIAKATRWLTKQQSRLLWEDRASPDRLFAEAEAFLFCGRVLGDDALLRIGQQFLDKGMKAYRPADGVFLENNGADPSYEATSLVRLQEIVLHFPDRSIEKSIASGVQWELAHINADGTVHSDAKQHSFFGSKMLMAPEKQANVGEVALALLYYHQRTGDPAALAAVERLHRHYTSPH